MQIDWVQFCAMLIALIGLLLSGFKWIIGRLDKISDELRYLRTEFVSKELCNSQHSESCRRLEDLEERVSELENKI